MLLEKMAFENGIKGQIHEDDWSEHARRGPSGSKRREAGRPRAHRIGWSEGFYTAEFLGLGTADTLGWIRFCSGWSICPMHCKVFNNISSFYPLEASSAPSHL